MPLSNLVPGYPAINVPIDPLVGAGSGGVYPASPTTVAGYAAGTVTLGGTPATGNTVAVTLNGHAVTYTLVGGDTNTTLVATHLAAALTADGTDSAIVTSTPTTNVVTITAKTAGSTGNYSLSVSTTGGGVTATASDTALDFANSYFIAKTTFAWRFDQFGGTKTFYKGVAYQIDSTNAALMRAAGYLY
jgi:hypothetical protein